MSEAARTSAARRAQLLLVGVGGQGVLTAAQILGTASQRAGAEVAVGQLHGMSQRGGSVECSVCIGAGQSSFIVGANPDVVLAFESLEALRALPRVGGESCVIVNRGHIPPPRFAAPNGAPGWELILPRLQAAAGRVLVVDGPRITKTVGVPRCLNVAMLGALIGSGALPLDQEAVWSAVAERTPPAYVDANRRAFELGRRAAT